MSPTDGARLVPAAPRFLWREVRSEQRMVETQFAIQRSLIRYSLPDVARNCAMLSEMIFIDAMAVWLKSA
jgi:hypothetical protein